MLLAEMLEKSAHFYSLITSDGLFKSRVYLKLWKQGKLIQLYKKSTKSNRTIWALKENTVISDKSQYTCK